jgi:hypothetical protein
MAIKANGQGLMLGFVQLPSPVVAAAQADRQIIGFPI